MQHSPFAAVRFHQNVAPGSQGSIPTNASQRKMPCAIRALSMSNESFEIPVICSTGLEENRRPQLYFDTVFLFQPVRVFKKVRYVVQFHNPDDEFDCDRRDPWMGLGGNWTRRDSADKIDMYEILGNKEMNWQEVNMKESFKPNIIVFFGFKIHKNCSNFNPPVLYYDLLANPPFVW